MRRHEAIKRLKDHETEFRRLGVEGLYLFGSTARDEAGDGSDVDLFFDHEIGALGLFEVVDVMDRAATIVGCKVDLMTRAGIHPHLRTRIESSAIRIFRWRPRIVSLRFADMIEAIERVQEALDGVPLESVECRSALSDEA